jgi:hypothetical protein
LLSHFAAAAAPASLRTGSGTTGQAVLELIAEDGGQRRSILCSSTEATAKVPDKNLCHEVWKRCGTRRKQELPTLNRDTLKPFIRLRLWRHITRRLRQKFWM